MSRRELLKTSHAARRIFSVILFFRASVNSEVRRCAITILQCRYYIVHKECMFLKYKHLLIQSEKQPELQAQLRHVC